MARNIGINNNNLKYQNRGLILKLIATEECVSRVDLAKRTGLSKMSVTNIVGEFISSNIVKEKNVELHKGQGRNPICLSIAPNAPKIAGLFIHREECVAVLCDMNLNVLKQEQTSLNEKNYKHLMDILYDLLDKVMDNEERVLGIGVGSVGPVDIKKGMILNPPNFFGIRDLPVTAILFERYRIPVYIDNQYNCAALAEKFFGIGKKYHDFIFVGITNGIGSGIISDGKLFQNSNGLTSELGHVSIDYKGNKCSCGNMGCMEIYAGIRVIQSRFQEATGEKMSFQKFCEREEHPKINEIFEDMIEKLACGLVSATNILNPQAFIIGHEGFYIPKKYIELLEQQINRRKLSGKYRHIEVQKSSFGDHAHLTGCACNILNRVFEGKL